jgi:hypothetical protein
MFETSGKGLEIGPSHNPLMPKKMGFDVEVLDYLDAEGLKLKYAAANVDLSAIEKVDYIADGRPMTEVIGERQLYDWIVASHVMKHVPDLVAFLIDCEALLKPGGSLVLAVPDKRYCFDILRPVSTVGQVLQAHVDDRKRPWPGVIFDDIAYARKRSGRIGWSLDDPNPLEEVRPPDAARHFFEQACRDESYVDVHCWVFVPSSFRLIINSLAAFGMTGLRELDFRSPGGEFSAVLSTRGPSQALDLGALALAAQAEEREIFLPQSNPQVPATQHALEAEAFNCEVGSGAGRSAASPPKPNSVGKRHSSSDRSVAALALSDIVASDRADALKDEEKFATIVEDRIREGARASTTILLRSSRLFVRRRSPAPPFGVDLRFRWTP